MAKDDAAEDTLPDKDAAKEFYAKYEPKEVLGRGISSTVRRCIEKETGNEFAAKIIDLSSDSEGEAQAMQEATIQEVNILRTVAGHPYIIDLHDVFESSTFIFLVFELCRNGELFDHLTNVVFEALRHVHRKGIVHRDVKPENILLDDQLNVKLTDFGFAKLLQPGEKLFDLCGTPGYLAPEVLRCNMFEDEKDGYSQECILLTWHECVADIYGTPGYFAPELLKAAMHEDTDGYGQAIDLWACGVVMYTLLVGCPPFWHRKQMVMLRNIMEGKYSFTSPEWEDITGDIKFNEYTVFTENPKDLIRKLLVVDPRRRLTVQEALDHPFFQVMSQDSPLTLTIVGAAPESLSCPRVSQYQSKKFDARKTFQFGILCVRAMVRIRRLRYTPEPLSMAVAQIDPYRIKSLRKVIDTCAFRVYGHWVKKGEGQNRAALFENYAKTELYQIYVSNLSR
ncbi:hypothetical protein B566_EDAN016798 [Ephemera danica]|nr:hypothetical protein B566_EDAN016798 [Ephemera danica]